LEETHKTGCWFFIVHILTFSLAATKGCRRVGILWRRHFGSDGDPSNSSESCSQLVNFSVHQKLF